jgi:hypothetical protein
MYVDNASPTIRSSILTRVEASNSSSLTIEGCLISGAEDAVLCLHSSLTITSSTVSDNVHRNMMPGSAGVMVWWGESLTASNCVFARNFNFGPGNGAISCYEVGQVYISSCTFVENGGYDSSNTTLGFNSWTTPIVENTVIAFGIGGSAIQCVSTPVLSCCDVYGNEGGDWAGCIADQYGINGNISEDPLFCDRAGGDYTIHADSPCAPEHSGGCGLIGALPVGCGATAVGFTTWGAIKASFK